MVRVWFLCFSFVLIKSYAISQTLTPEVVSASGDYFKTTNASLSWTIGEGVTETFASSNNKLTQGFQQGNFYISSMSETPDSSIKINFYPNPSKDFITISLTDQNLTDEILIYDFAGKIIFRKISTGNKYNLDLSGISAGVYFMKISAGNSSLKTFKIQKVN